MLSRLIRALSQRGPRRTWKNIRDRFRWRTFGVYRLGQPGNSIPPPGVEFREGLAELREARAGLADLPYQFYLDRSLGYDRCFVAWIGERPVSIVWAARNASSWLALDEGHVEACGVATTPEARNKGIASALESYACARLLASGVERVYGVVEENNLASRAMTEKAGLRRVATLRRPALFGPRFRSDLERTETWGEAFRRLLRSR